MSEGDPLTTDAEDARIEDGGFGGIGLRDRMMIADLIARYSIARDDRELDDLAACFSRAGSFTRADRRATGRQQIKEFFARSIDHYDVTRHITHTHVLSRRDAHNVGGVVTGSADLVRSGTLVQAAYRYADVYVLEDDEWRILDRRIAFMYAMPPTEFGVGFSDENRIRWPGQSPRAAEIR